MDSQTISVTATVAIQTHEGRTEYTTTIAHCGNTLQPGPLAEIAWARSRAQFEKDCTEPEPETGISS